VIGKPEKVGARGDEDVLAAASFHTFLQAFGAQRDEDI
jgi:hypothetical protein